jgi:hypothetical protein
LAVLRSANSLLAVVLALGAASTVSAHSTGKHATPPVQWSVRLRVVEASTGAWPCSHIASSIEAACRYNRVLVVESGEMNNVLLDGARFWMAGEKVAGSAADTHDWAVVTFDPAVMLEQRTALLTIVRALYPLQWIAFTVGNPSPVELAESGDGTAARLGEGALAELSLVEGKGARALPSGEALRYGDAARIRQAADRPSRSQAYRDGAKRFEAGPGGGFVITLEMSSDEARPAAVER